MNQKNKELKINIGAVIDEPGNMREAKKVSFRNLMPVIDYSKCIKCGRCVDVCPMELYPLYYAYYGKNQMWERCVEYRVKSCIECGCCDYICSSKISIVSLIKKAKKNAYYKT